LKGIGVGIVYQWWEADDRTCGVYVNAKKEMNFLLVKSDVMETYVGVYAYCHEFMSCTEQFDFTI
jgi:hypothetical protein